MKSNALEKQSGEGLEKESFEDNIIRNVVFAPRLDKKTGKILGYQGSSYKTKKSIELLPRSVTPHEGKAYDVEVVSDSDLNDPDKGTYVVEIIGSVTVDEMTPSMLDSFKKDEGEVQAAELINRRRLAITRRLHKNKIDDKTPPEEETEGRQSLSKAWQELNVRELRVALKKMKEDSTEVEKDLTEELNDEGEQESAILEVEVNDILGPENSSMRSLIAFQKKNLIRALRESSRLKTARETLLIRESLILEQIEEAKMSGEADPIAVKNLDEIREGLVEVAEKESKLPQENPEAFFGLHLQQLKKYRKQLKSKNATGKKGKDGKELGGSGIVETPYVQRQETEVIAHLKAHTPVMVYGHFGSGKTELAMKAAMDYTGKPALIVSGHKHISTNEFFGHQVLDVDSIDQDQVESYTKEVLDKVEEFKVENPDATEAEIERYHDSYLEIFLTQFASGTKSKFFLGPIYDAMKEGRIVIIDEFNAIPHEVLISLNHILTRREGDKINIQQDDGEEIIVNKGFGIIATGNLNVGSGAENGDQYVDRQKMDPAFLDRFHKMEHDYLPQSIEGSLSEAGENDELFHLLLAAVMDSHGDIIDSDPEILKKLWRLAQASRITQDVFAGKQVNEAFFLLKKGKGSGQKYRLQESVLSLRTIMKKIMNQWESEERKFEMDHYIWTEFLANATLPSDRFYLYQLLQTRFGFFDQTTGWPRCPDWNGEEIASFTIKAPANKLGRRKSFGPRDVVTAAFGAPPERTDWPALEADQINAAELENELHMDLKSIKKAGAPASHRALLDELEK